MRPSRSTSTTGFHCGGAVGDMDFCERCHALLSVFHGAAWATSAPSLSMCFICTLTTSARNALKAGVLISFRS